jgi:hypothetical protein
MMPLEDIRCTLALCPNREAREEAQAWAVVAAEPASVNADFDNGTTLQLMLAPG